MDKNFYKTLKVANYNRKSQDSEDKQVLSIPSQREEAQKLKNSLGVVDMVSYEDTKSAKTPRFRNQFSNMMDDLKTGKRDAILCWKLDRLARNMDEGGEIIDLLQRGIIKAIITPYKTYFPNENALLMAIEFGSANQFSRDLSVNVKRGQDKKARMGIPHGLAAIGFINDKSEEKGNRRWLVDAARFPIIKEIFKLYLTGQYSGGQMYDWALKAALTTPKHKRNGGKPITPSRIYKILKDTTYAGFFYQGGQRYELDKTLPRIITEEEHYKVLRMLSGRNIPKTQIHQSPYSGFILSPKKEFIGSDFKYQVICECKYKFSYINKTNCSKCGIEINKITDPKYLEYEYYYNVSLKKKKLPIKCLRDKEVTKFLTEFSEKFTLSPALAKWSRKYIHELRDAEVESNLIIAEGQKERLETLEKKKENYRGLLAEGMIEREEYEHDIRKINSEIEKIKDNSKKSPNWLQEAEKIVDLGLELKKIIKNGSVAAKREILSKLGSNLIWDEKELFISNTKPIQILIDGLEWSKQKNPRFEPENIVDTSEQNSDFWDIRPKMLRG
ncbi:MAG: recombinase family protein [bacterium]|nr:recombinase family protein [bacterium]